MGRKGLLIQWKKPKRIAVTPTIACTGLAKLLAVVPLNALATNRSSTVEELTMQCFKVTFYFRKGNKSRLLRGVYCGCIRAETREKAIQSVSPVEVGAGCTLVRVCAKQSPKGHICTISEEELRS